MLALIASMLGMGTSASAPSARAAHTDLAAHVEFAQWTQWTPWIDDGEQHDIAAAEFEEFAEPEESAESCDDDDSGDGDDRGWMTAHHSELSVPLPPLSVSTRSGAGSVSRYRSFVSEPSTPPPRA